MKILILGTGKSGTTALVYKVAGGLPNCKAFSGGRPGKYIGDYENAVYKHTYQERKGKSFDLYEEGGTVVILATRVNIRHILSWSRRRNRILDPFPFTTSVDMLLATVGPSPKRKWWRRRRSVIKI
jgi:hypothetical protein